MLEKLDEIDWGSLTHAYGDASDVPGLIRALASQDEKEHENALWQLYGNIFHQGTRYEAAASTVPFIYELLQEPSVIKKHELIKFLVSLAFGYEESYLPWGPRVDIWRKQYEEKSLPKNESLFTPLYDDYTLLKWEIDVYDEVLKGIPILIGLLDNEDEIIVYFSTYALAWFRENAKESAHKVRNLLDRDMEPYLLANTLIALGLLDFYNNDNSDLPRFEEIIKGEKNMLVREAAAIARTTVSPADIPDFVIDFLFESIIYETYLKMAQLARSLIKNKTPKEIRKLIQKMKTKVFLTTHREIRRAYHK